MQLRGSQLERGFVIGGYRIDELISRGGMGVVYRVTNIGLNRIYALKVLAPELADDPAFRERFQREMRIAASINNPNVVGIHYAGEQDGLVFFVMDFIQGTDLREMIKQSGALEPHRAVDLLSQFASALDAAHARGLVHRDVKPANILITIKDGEEHAYLTDFGVAKRSDTAAGLTAQGAVVGTVDYMSPEQITGGHTDARTDVYALGCVFFQMLTGSVPYERENSIAKLFAHVHEDPPAVSQSIANSYPAFGEVLDKAMAKEPSDRYLSAGDFARDAAAALRGSRYTGPATMVGTGEAMPSDSDETSSTGASFLDPRDADLDRTSATPAPSRTSPPTPPEPATPQTAPPEPEEATQLAAAAPPEATAAPPETTAAPPGATAAPPEATAPPPGATAPPPGATVAPPGETAPPWSEPAAAASAAGAFSETTAAGAGGPGDTQPGVKSGGAFRRYRGLIAAIALGAIAAIVIVVVSSGGGGGGSGGLQLKANADPVPTNRVTGQGTAEVVLSGDKADVKLNTHGLLNGSPHAMHIHAGGQGICPPASAARLHNGHLSISTTNGIKFYGPPEVALTSTGDTSPKSIVDFSRYPSTGDISYTRDIAVPPGVASAIRAGNAVIVVHGIDYNGNHTYDDTLDRSELKASLPGEATAPALCGTLSTTKVASAGGGSKVLVASATLHVYHPTAAQEQAEFVYLCHLAGIPVPAADRPVSGTRVTGASGGPA